MVAILTPVIVVYHACQSSTVVLRKKNRLAVQENAPQMYARDCALTRKREIEISTNYTAIQMSQDTGRSFDRIDLFDRQRNFAGDYLEWLFLSRRLAQSGSLIAPWSTISYKFGRVD